MRAKLNTGSRFYCSLEIIRSSFNCMKSCFSRFHITAKITWDDVTSIHAKFSLSEYFRHFFGMKLFRLARVI